MTEDYKLPVYFNFYPDTNQPSDLKIIYICEEQNEYVTQRLSEISTQIFSELNDEKLVSFIEHSELIMFNEI